MTDEFVAETMTMMTLLQNDPYDMTVSAVFVFLFCIRSAVCLESCCPLRYRGQSRAPHFMVITRCILFCSVPFWFFFVALFFIAF